MLAIRFDFPYLFRSHKTYRSKNQIRSFFWYLLKFLSTDRQKHTERTYRHVSFVLCNCVCVCVGWRGKVSLLNLSSAAVRWSKYQEILSLSLSPLFCPLTRDATLDKHRIASIPIPAIDTGIERKEGGQRNGVAGRTAISTTAQIYWIYCTST
jgi:hypothetical protein